MPTTAKFKVSQVNTWTQGKDNDPVAAVLLVPDYADGRNSEWAKYTPSGTISMTITNPVAIEQFTQGRQFTVTFEAEDENLLSPSLAEKYHG